MLTLVAIAGILGATTVGGVFYAFSTFVMGALAQLPPAHGIAAMQRINVVVLNPMFLGAFIGTALLQVACALLAFSDWTPVRSPLLLAAAVLYVVGCVGVTAAFNVPRNERLKSLPADGPGARDYWAVYLREWTWWNHVRTAASLAAGACGIVALLP
ncbi:MAG: DUF1772 domain-containing protein [Vicinamibacterales bacterium]